MQISQRYDWQAVEIVVVLALLGLQALLVGLLLVERARRKRASSALRAAARVFGTTGEVYFRSLTEHLHSVLQVDYVSIGELSDSGRSMKTVAVSAGGKNLENLEYELEHTPCQEVLQLGRYFARTDVQSRFPLDVFLVELAFQSYLGVALVDSTGSRLGVMSVMSRRPLKDPGIAELTLNLFAARTSVEMERRRSKHALHSSESRNLRNVTDRKQAESELDRNRIFFEHIARTMPGVLFVYDLMERRNIYTNQGGWGLLGYTDEEVLEMGDSFLPRLMHPDDLSRLPRLAEEYARAADNEVLKHVFRMRHKNGEWRSVLRHVTIFARTSTGRPQQLIGTAIDITELKNAEGELRQLSTRLLSAQDQERRRIARELHDGTAQNLFAIRLNLRQLEDRGVSSGMNILLECQKLCDVSLQEIRTLSYLLHPPMLDEGGLIPAMRWFVEGFAKRSGLQVELEVPETTERLSTLQERDLFLVLQEALANVVRHSGSNEAVVRLEIEPSEVILLIRDFGRGMPRDTAAGKPDLAAPGVGIPSMRERLRQIDGQLEFQSSSEGTTVIAIVPLQSESR